MTSPRSIKDAVGVRLDNIEQDIIQLSAAVDSRATAVSVTALGVKIDTLSNDLARKRETQWQPIFSAMSVVLAVISVVGGLAYWPVLTNAARLEGRIEQLAAMTVPRAEIELSREAAMRERLDTQRQLDELRTVFGGQVTIKDAFQEHSSRMNRLQEELNALRLERAWPRPAQP